MRKLVFLFSLLISLSSLGQTAKIKQLEAQRKQALHDITNTDKLLRDTKKTTASLLDRIKLISNQISTRQKVVSLLNQEIDGILVEQQRIETDIVRLEGELKQQQNSYAKAIDGMLRNRQSENKLLFILSGRSLAESYRRMRYLRDYSEWRSKQASEIKEKGIELKEQKEILAKTKAGKMALLGLREKEQNNLKKEEENYQGEVGEAQKKQKDLQKLLTQKRNQAAALDQQIAKLIAEEVARQEREAKRLAEEKARREALKGKGNKNSQGGNTSPKSQIAPKISEADLALSSNFASNKGRLPYPISGNYTISNRFGTHQRSQYVTTSSSGIDIQSQPGSDAKAVFNGEVTRVMAFPGFNTCIIIRHGGYYTFYGNIQNVYVKQGDKVTTGQTLGKVFTDPETNIAQIHFQLWNGTTKQNPEPWLR